LEPGGAPVRLRRERLPVPGAAWADRLPLPRRLLPDRPRAMSEAPGSVPPLDRALAEPRHLLVLPSDVEVAEVDALAASHFDDAGWLGPTTLRITGHAHLTGPWALDDALRRAFDLPPWAVLAFLLRCPVQRSGPVPRELLGLGGLLDAFPEGP